MHTLQSLRIFGLDPSSGSARHAVALVAEHARWEHAGQRFFDGEVEPCINGRTIEIGAYFGVDVGVIVERILDERLADGGWNCEAENGSVVSSFDTTINVLDGLLEVEQASGGTDAVRDARRRGERYLLERGLFRGKRSGEVVDPAYLDAAFPYYWRYDVLRALDYFRRTGADPDPVMAEAVEGVRSKRGPDGRWPLDRIHPGPCPLRHRGRDRHTQPVEHVACPARARLVGSGRRGDLTVVRLSVSRRTSPTARRAPSRRRHGGQLALHPCDGRRRTRRRRAAGPSPRRSPRPSPPRGMSASPAPDATSTGALRNWSAPWGTTRCGTPNSRAARIVAGPPWLMIAVQCGSSSSWATKSVTRTCGGCGPRVVGSAPGPTVTITLTGSVARPSSAARNTWVLAWNSVPSVRCTVRSWGSAASSAALHGSRSPGPTSPAPGRIGRRRRNAATASRCSDGGHSSRNGSSTMSSTSDGTAHASHSSPKRAPNHDHASAGSGPKPWTSRRAPLRSAATAPASSVIGWIDEVGLPGHRSWHEVLGAAQGGGAEDAGDDRRHPDRRVDDRDVRHDRAERGVRLGPARADVPRLEAAAPGLDGHLGAGRHDDVVAGARRGAGEREHRQEVAVGRPGRDEDAHRASKPHRVDRCLGGAGDNWWRSAVTPDQEPRRARRRRRVRRRPSRSGSCDTAGPPT